MGKYFLKRLGFCVFVLLGVSIISFILVHLAPGNPAELMLGDGATPDQIAAMEVELGLDKPLVEQYFLYMKGVLQGDLGDSIFFKRPCLDVIKESLPATLTLTVTAIFVCLLISIPMGVIAGVKRGSLVDLGAMSFAILGQSLSAVWLGILLVLVFAVKLQWLPAFGYGTAANMIMPSITLGVPTAALICRLTRAGMIDVMSEDYILNAMSKGIPKSRVVVKYALKNVLIPVITVVGVQIGTFLGGAVVTEQIFSLPGIGRMIVQSISRRDFPLIQSGLLVISAMFVFVNLLVDMLYAVIDPRLATAYAGKKKKKVQAEKKEADAA